MSYIDKEKLGIGKANVDVFENKDYARGWNSAVELIENAPTEDVAPIRHGKWVGIEYDGYADGFPVYSLFECSDCGYEHKGEEDTLTCYCPNCGAKMDLESGGGKMSKYMNKAIIFMLVFLLISCCWIGFEYLIEGVIHSSVTDTIIAIILTYLLLKNKGGD